MSSRLETFCQGPLTHAIIAPLGTGNIRIVEGQALRVTKAFGKSSAFLNPNADGLATSSSWGFHDFCQLSELPPSFTIEAEIIVREVARDDALALHVTSLAELKKHYPRGQSTLGFVYVDPEGGKWSLCLYPNGDNLSREGQLGVFVKVLALPRGVTVSHKLPLLICCASACSM